MLEGILTADQVHIYNSHFLSADAMPNTGLRVSRDVYFL